MPKGRLIVEFEDSGIDPVVKFEGEIDHLNISAAIYRIRTSYALDYQMARRNEEVKRIQDHPEIVEIERKRIEEKERLEREAEAKSRAERAEQERIEKEAELERHRQQILKENKELEATRRARNKKNKGVPALDIQTMTEEADEKETARLKAIEDAKKKSEETVVGDAELIKE